MDPTPPKLIYSNQSNKKKSKKKFGLIVSATLLLLLGCVDCETNYVVLTIKFSNPCYSIESHVIANSTFHWCENAFNSSILEPINKFCEPHNRVLLVKSNIHDINKEGLNSILSIKRIQIVKPDSDEETESKIKKITESTIAVKFLLIKAAINEIGLNWKRDIVDEQLFYSSALNITLPRSLNINEFRPHFCYFDSISNLMIIEVKRRQEFYQAKIDTAGKTKMKTIFAGICSVLAISLFINFMLTLHYRRNYNMAISCICNLKLRLQALGDNLPPYPEFIPFESDMTLSTEV